MSLNVSLPAEMEQRVREHVASGLYGSASEVIREALRLFEAYQAAQAASLASLTQAASLASLKSEIAQGLADVQAGRVGVVEMDAIKAQGQATRKAKASA